MPAREVSEHYMKTCFSNNIVGKLIVAHDTFKKYMKARCEGREHINQVYMHLLLRRVTRRHARASSRCVFFARGPGIVKVEICKKTAGRVAGRLRVACNWF